MDQQQAYENQSIASREPFSSPRFNQTVREVWPRQQNKIQIDLDHNKLRIRLRCFKSCFQYSLSLNNYTMLFSLFLLLYAIVCGSKLTSHFWKVKVFTNRILYLKIFHKVRHFTKLHLGMVWGKWHHHIYCCFPLDLTIHGFDWYQFSFALMSVRYKHSSSRAYWLNIQDCTDAFQLIKEGSTPVWSFGSRRAIFIVLWNSF